MSRIKADSILIHHLFGLFSLMITVWTAAFFIPINFGFYVAIFVINILLLYFFKNEVIASFKNRKVEFKRISISLKALFLVLFLVTLAQSATKPSLFDNESYYLQTIKWLNEFGFVKGLGNLHIFFAQTSGWHILQSGFSFPFFDAFFNDINGFLLVLFGWFSVKRLNEYFITQKRIDLFAGSILFFAPFFMLFVNSPSPDLPIYLLTHLIFYLFLRHYNEMSTSKFTTIVILTIFVCLIKVTGAILLLIPLFLFINRFNVLKKLAGTCMLFLVIILILFVSKNIIISGYALYPLEVFNVFNVDWKIPQELLFLYKNETYKAAFDYKEVSYLSFGDRFLAWMNSYKFNGIFKKVFIFLLLIFPFFWKLKNRKKSVLYIYGLAIINFSVIWHLSPQYRFFFVFIVFLSLLIFIYYVKREKAIIGLLSLCILINIIPFFTSINLSSFTTIKKTAISTTSLSYDNLIFPSSNSGLDATYKKVILNNFEFYSPSEEAYFWSSGDGELPCVNKKQVEFIQKHYEVTPSLRTSFLKDGFISVKQ
jgi:hypothetical protein